MNNSLFKPDEFAENNYISHQTNIFIRKQKIQTVIHMFHPEIRLGHGPNALNTSYKKQSTFEYLHAPRALTYRTRSRPIGNSPTAIQQTTQMMIITANNPTLNKKVFYYTYFATNSKPFLDFVSCTEPKKGFAGCTGSSMVW